MARGPFGCRRKLKRAKSLKLSVNAIVSYASGGNDTLKTTVTLD